MIERIQTEIADLDDAFFAEALREETVKQVDRLNDLAKELFKLQLAIPGLFLAALRISEPGFSQMHTNLLILATILWLIGLGVNLQALFPRNYRVSEGFSDKDLNPRTFYQKAADFKYVRLLAGLILFIAGTLSAAVSIFISP